MSRQVLFLGDVRRGAQTWNIVRIANLFSPVFKQIQAEHSVFASKTNDLTILSEWLDSWANSLQEDNTADLEKLDLDNSAIVGFEVPEIDLAYLSKAGVPWINLAIHPLRFLDDLYFDVKTSFDYDLQHLSAGRGLIEFCVNSIRFRNRRFVDIQSNSQTTLVIFGQTPIDRSVFFDGEFKSLTNYLDKLDELAAQHERIVYRPHPNAAGSEIDRLICERYGAEKNTGGDVYDFFVSGSISTACAISSSVLEEAPYFGIRSEYLEPRARKFGAPVSYRRLLDEQNFWAQGLLGRTEPVAPEIISAAVPAGFLRKHLESWGFVSEESILNTRIADTVKLSQTATSFARAAEENAKRVKSDVISLEESVKAQVREVKNQMAQKDGILNQIELRVLQIENSIINHHHNIDHRHDETSERTGINSEAGPQPRETPDSECNEMKFQVLEALSAVKNILTQATDHQTLLSRSIKCLQTDALRELDKALSATEVHACRARIRDIQRQLPAKLATIEEQSLNLKKLLALLESGVDGFIEEQRQR